MVGGLQWGRNAMVHSRKQSNAIRCKNPNNAKPFKAFSEPKGFRVSNATLYFLYKHTHTHTHTHTHKHTHAHTHAHTRTHARTHIRMHTRTHTRTHTHTHIHTHMYKRAQSTHKLPVHSAKGFASNFSASLAMLPPTCSLVFPGDTTGTLYLQSP